MLNSEICYSHACCTPFEVKRRTKSACVSKTSMPSFSTKRRKANPNKSNLVAARSNIKKKAAVKPRMIQRVGEVISRTPIPVSYLDIKKPTKSPEVKSLQAHRKRSKNKIQQDMSTQTVDLQSARYIWTGLTPHYVKVPEGRKEHNTQGWLKGTTPLESGCSYNVLSDTLNRWKTGSGGTGHTDGISKLDVCCFPLININPSFTKKFDDECSTVDSKAYTEKVGQLENESLMGYIYQAQDKVNNIRTRLVELNQTLMTQTATSISPRDSKGMKKLQKALDGIIKEVNAVSEIGRNCSVVSDASPCRSPKGCHKPTCGFDYCAGDLQFDHRVQFQSKKEPSSPRRTPQSLKSLKVPEIRNKTRKVRSPGSLGEESSSSAGKESSLTLLKKELGGFFKKMKMETNQLMEDAQMHHKVLLQYSVCNSASSSDVVSSDSSGL